MVDVLAEWLGFVGTDFVAPETLAEFFPYFFTCLLGFCLVAGILQLVRFVVGGMTRGGRSFW